MYDEILSKLNELSDKELSLLILEIEELKECRNKDTIVYLQYDKNKGSGDCWVAYVCEWTGEVISFVKPLKCLRRGNKGEKVFKLKEGEYYLLCEVGYKGKDNRSYCYVKDGNLIEFKPITI